DLDQLLADLNVELQAKAGFLRGSTVTLDAASRVMGQETIERIRAVLAEHDLNLEAVISEDDTTAAAAEELNLKVRSPIASRGPQSASPATMAYAGVSRQASPLEGSRGMLVRHVVRSGKIVRHQGHVAIIGDVNPGGAIIAGGDVIVWGSLRGTAHAGAFGDTSAVICALDMQPLQLRIAEVVARPGDHAALCPGPEMAKVLDGRIVVEPWSGRS
ncbi:MAG: septum site-determining protein MinC, partial [Anaerolineae bacterium]